MSFVVVGLGGMAGAIARYLVYLGERALGWHQFPLATLLVNILGSFLGGALLALLQTSALPKHFLLFATVGFLGSFTTFSTLAVESFSLFHSGRAGAALFTLFLNIALGLGGVLLGWKLGLSLSTPV